MVIWQNQLRFSNFWCKIIDAKYKTKLCISYLFDNGNAVHLDRTAVAKLPHTCRSDRQFFVNSNPTRCSVGPPSNSPHIPSSIAARSQQSRISFSSNSTPFGCLLRDSPFYPRAVCSCFFFVRLKFSLLFCVSVCECVCVWVYVGAPAAASFASSSHPTATNSPSCKCIRHLCALIAHGL